MCETSHLPALFTLRNRQQPNVGQDNRIAGSSSCSYHTDWCCTFSTFIQQSDPGPGGQTAEPACERVHIDTARVMFYRDLCISTGHSRLQYSQAWPCKHLSRRASGTGMMGGYLVDDPLLVSWTTPESTNLPNKSTVVMNYVEALSVGDINTCPLPSFLCLSLPCALQL